MPQTHKGRFEVAEASAQCILHLAPISTHLPDNATGDNEQQKNKRPERTDDKSPEVAAATRGRHDYFNPQIGGELHDAR
eukprot:4371589-Prymnesium_polylepis.2